MYRGRDAHNQLEYTIKTSPIALRVRTIPRPIDSPLLNDRHANECIQLWGYVYCSKTGAKRLLGEGTAIESVQIYIEVYHMLSVAELDILHQPKDRGS